MFGGMDGWMDGCLVEWLDGWMFGGTDGWMDDGCLVRMLRFLLVKEFTRRESGPSPAHRLSSLSHFLCLPFFCLLSPFLNHISNYDASARPPAVMPPLNKNRKRQVGRVGGGILFEERLIDRARLARDPAARWGHFVAVSQAADKGGGGGGGSKVRDRADPPPHHCHLPFSQQVGKKSCHNITKPRAEQQRSRVQIFKNHFKGHSAVCNPTATITEMSCKRLLYL